MQACCTSASRVSGHKGWAVVVLLAALGCLAAESAAAQLWTGTASLGVQVRSTRGGPLADATVVLRYRRPGGNVGPEAKLTDSKGQANFVGLAAGRWSLEIRHPDFLSFVASVEIAGGKKPQVVSQFLEASGAGRGTLKVKFLRSDKAFGQPVPGTAADASPPPEPRTSPEPPAPAPRSIPERTDTERTASRPVPPADVPAAGETPSVPVPDPTARPAPPPPSSPAPAEPEAPSADIRPTEVPEPQKTAPPLSAPMEPKPERPAAPEPESSPAATATPAPVPPVPAPPMPPKAAPAPESTPPARVAPQDPPADPPTADVPEPEPTLPEVPKPEAPVAPKPAEEALPEPAATPPSEPEPLPRPAAVPVPEPEVAETPEPAEAIPPPAPSPDSAAAETAPGMEAAAPDAAAGALRSYGDRTCSDCKPGEWAVAVEVAAVAGEACRPTAERAVRRAMRDVAAAASDKLGTYAGPLPLDPASVPLVLSTEAARNTLATYLQPDSACRLLAAVIPEGGRFTGFRFEAWDATAQGECAGSGECAVGQARFAFSPGIARGLGASIVYTLFENTGAQERTARMSGFFVPSSGWRP